MARSKKPKSPDLTQTPEECKKTAKSFADLPKEFQMPAEELEMVQEELQGKALKYGTPAAAIEAMQRRLALFKKNKAKTSLALEECEDAHLRKDLKEELKTLNKEIEAAQTRLDAYKFQQTKEN
jgi:hypothetical protein